MTAPSEKYQYPVASRQELIKLLSNSQKPLSLKEIIKKLKIKKHLEKQEGIRRRLSAMVRDGQILKNRNDRFGVLAKMHLVKGTVQGNKEGFGFLIPEDGAKDLFIHFKQMTKVMHGDKVLAQRVEFKGRDEARIVEVIEYANKVLVARYISEAGVGIGIPVNTRIRNEIIIPESKQNQAQNNEMVLIEIIKPPGKHFQAVGKVIEILGTHLDPGMEIDVALHAWGVPHVWPDEVLKFVGKISPNVSQSDFNNRIDLTKTPFITIDGEDSKDFDDAVWCEPINKAWRVRVAIADVSHYLPITGALNDEAVTRATSVYFPEFVVPMLPEVLSNGICSLNPDENRLALVCEMIVSDSGLLQSYDFFQAVIKSHARLSYTQVNHVLTKSQDNDSLDLGGKLPVIFELHKLYKALNKQRQLRGALDFDTFETVIEFDQNKKIKQIVPSFRNDAHKLIEELMILANVCAGKFVQKHKLPALYRVHESPKSLKIADLRQFLSEFNIELKGQDSPKPKDYSQVLKQAKTKPEYELIKTVLLRSQNQAVYTPENLGHFGLAQEIYAHFTSPIRRYPDVLVHRAIKHVINHKGKKYHYQADEMVKLGKLCSLAERRADDATRDVVDWLKCEFMQDKVGDTFQGKVSSVTSFGLFVRLDKFYIDGLVHISSLPQDYYHFNAVRHRLEGRNKIYCIGDELRVIVARVNLDERKIDFVVEKKTK